MSTEVLTHWKDNFNYAYLGAYSINGTDLIGTIKQVKKESVTGTNGKSEECTICYFSDLEKPMILNKTNCKIISKMYGTPYIEEWAGKQISLYKANVSAFGEQIEAIRIRSEAPNAELPSINEDRLDKAIGQIEVGKYSVEKLLSTFKLTDSQMKKIKTI